MLIIIFGEVSLIILQVILRREYSAHLTFDIKYWHFVYYMNALQFELPCKYHGN